MRPEPVEWSDPAFERRIGPLDVAAGQALYELFFGLCVEDRLDLAIGTVAARGCWWTWLAAMPSSPDTGEVVTRLAVRVLTPDELRRVEAAVLEEMLESRDGRLACAVVARNFGVRHAAPLEKFYLLGSLISCAMDVLKRQGL